MADAADPTTGPASPLVWRRWLGAELVRLRTSVSLTQRDVATALHCSVAKVSYLESGDRAVSPRELADVLLPLYEIPEEKWNRYLTAAEVANKQGWWDHWEDEDLRPQERRYIGLEDGAKRLRSFQSTIVHGLMQTPQYTRAVLRAFQGFPEERIARLVDLRRIRQSELTRTRSPLEVHVIYDEAAVRRQIGGPTVLSAQQIYMADVAEQLPNVTIQIVPLDRGAYGAHFGPFTILDFPWSNDPGLLFFEGLVRSDYIETRREVYEHSLLFDRIAELALSSQESIKMLRDAARVE